MSNSRKLATLFAATIAATMMTGTSAFAETRHRDETRDQQFRSQSNDRNRNDSRNNSSYRNDNNRNNSNYRNNDSYRGNTTARRSENFQGRVSRVERYRGGYNVWVGGARYPFFIAADRWARFPIRVGLSIRLGGYWNPGGYYDVYDVGPYATAGSLHGIVENIDYRRGTLVMRDDVSGSFVTVVMRGNDPRFGSLRQGDYIDLNGAWNRSGVFDAVNVPDIRGGYDPRYDGRGGY